MVQIDSLTKTYGAQRAIDELSFSVNQGEILGFLGPNGAGKSTTMKILTGFLPATSGTATVAGFDVEADPLEVRKRVGYLPEHNPLYLDMYVHEFLAFVGRVYGIKGKRLKTRIGEVIEMTGLQREQHKKIGALSKGYRQRVGLSQALIHDPQVLILDEPTTGLDPNQIVEIRQLIRDIRDHGEDKTVIFSSHILPEVEAVADRVIIINRGKIVANQAMQELQANGGEGFVLKLEVAEAGFDTTQVETWEGVNRIEKQEERAFTIYTSGEVDIRRQLFETCVQQKNPLLGLEREAASLEDAFRRLTGSAVETKA